MRKNKAKVEGGGQTLSGINERTGLKNRCLRHDSEYPLAPKSSLKDAPRGDSASPSPPSPKASLSPALYQKL